MELLTAAGVVNEFFHLHESGAEEYLLRRRKVGDWAEIVEHALNEGVSSVTFRTSGSSGSPKRVTHGWDMVLQETGFLAELLKCRNRVVSTVPAHHIYGFLFTVLLPELVEIPVLPLSWEGIGTLSGSLKLKDLVVSHPTLWHYLYRSLGEWPASIWGVSSTAPLPEELHQGLYDSGVDRLLEVYGSTETGGVGFRERPGEPFTLFPYYRRPPGAESAGGGDEESQLERLSPGGTGWQRVEIMDTFSWFDERRFLPVGRKDRVVQVGGENVSLTRVEAVIAEDPEVEAVSVRLGGAGPEARLKAFVVPVPGSNLEVERLSELCRMRLRPVERPRSFTIDDELPRNPLGKVVDWPV
ncbi:MAG: AMP-binding protein [Spirochaetaceae bacterium]